MKKFYLALAAISICLGGYAQQRVDTLCIYSKGKVIERIIKSKVDSITFSKVGIDGKSNDDYVTQIINKADGAFKMSVTSVDSVTVHKQKTSSYEMVDLGLSVEWASFNVGAKAPEEYGGLYGWADPTGKKTTDDYDQYPDANPPYDITATDMDIAHVQWGGNWQMPSVSHFVELYNNCTHEWTTVNGVNGMKFTAKNGNSIFLPAGGYRYTTSVIGRGDKGYYWTGQLYEKGASYAYFMYLDNSNKPNLDVNGRIYGRSIRPVYIK